MTTLRNLEVLSVSLPVQDRGLMQSEEESLPTQGHWPMDVSVLVIVLDCQRAKMRDKYIYSEGQVGGPAPTGPVLTGTALGQECKQWHLRACTRPRRVTCN